MKIVVIIPARYGSTRFVGKPLVLFEGKPMIQQVYERARLSNIVTDVVVATDDQRIFDAVSGFGGNAVMTGKTLFKLVAASILMAIMFLGCAANKETQHKGFGKQLMEKAETIAREHGKNKMIGD